MQQFVNGNRLQNQLKWRRLYQQVTAQSSRPPGDLVDQAHVIHVRQSIELLRQLIDQAGGQTWLTLEGDLSRFNSVGLHGLVRESTHQAPAADEFFAPLHNRVSIPLHNGNVSQLKATVLPHVGIRTHIIHLFLESNQQRLFAAHNKFQQCTLFGGWLTHQFLTQLQQDGVIELKASSTFTR